MRFMSARVSSGFSFNGQIAKCEVFAIDENSRTRIVYSGATLKEAFDNFRNGNAT